MGEEDPQFYIPDNIHSPSRGHDVLKEHDDTLHRSEKQSGMADRLATGDGTHRPRRKSRKLHKTVIAFSILASTIPMASAQSCISLSGSTQCPAFKTSSISTDKNLIGLYPFLAFVSTREDFDQRLSQYVTSDYVQLKYQRLLGCSNVTLTNTTSYYARYTTSVICNAIVQNSIEPCKLSAANSPPLCADSCAQMAISEEEITTNTKLCGQPGQSFMDQIRADFVNCALPARSLSGSCITGEENESQDCGFATNVVGLCAYCSLSSPNATDSCCVGSDVNHRCQGVVLPPTNTMPVLFPSSTSSSSPSATNGTASGATADPHGLGAAQVAGIVVGSVLGAALLLALLALCCICFRRRKRGSPQGSIFNQPSPRRADDPPMAYAPRESTAPPPGRVARMAALEGTSSDEPARGGPVVAAEQQRSHGYTSDSDPYAGDSDTRPEGGRPVTTRRRGSLSSNSVFGGLAEDDTSPNSGSGQEYSSPEGIASGQSEQLPSFRDYYSQDEIHPGDRVATLWAYQPRAGDEFELERGDMLKVVGIWDDGWATGVLISDRAEDYRSKNPQRDSGVSNGSAARAQSPAPSGEIKAFPLVCVCLPEHWRKTIAGDESPHDGAAGPPAGMGGY